MNRLRSFPPHAFLGFALLILSEWLHLRKMDPFYSWFYCFAWWSYIFTIDGVIYGLKGNSLIVSRTREFFLMIPWSIFIWLLFEAANLVLKNWYYINLPHSTIERWAGYAIAYGTVLPGLFETMELLETMGLWKNVRTKQRSFLPPARMAMVFFGILCLSVSILIPRYGFSLIWIGFTFLLEPINAWRQGRSLLGDIEAGIPRKFYLLLLAGMICGLLWEFWNFWARSKWVYTVPFFDRTKGFEMPLLGFFGFPPFAVEAYVMYHFISLFRVQKGWEESTFRLDPTKKPRPLTRIVAAVLVVGFCILMFRAIDLHTVDSYYPRLEDAYWIEPHFRKEFPKVGIFQLEDLVAKTRDRREREELALRLLIPKEKLSLWIPKAELALLKGLGIKNLRLLEGVGVDSVQELAAETPQNLYKKMLRLYKNKRIPSEAKIHIWVREARRYARTP